ncbi:phosphoglucosamine mutase [Methanobrevibacter filiformis]|uniref:Probable phosphoglucosamine mutase n=1 Tax=Methanobrevibacter filiformis TaxID=55758 RepID=A0A166AI84_9EURY|nr:phosphoglucosamine mutase [Methanobrevibacter filiformis]KZX12066.1 phosphoglucosamine mutase [Methanobrevibacter filiformis]
MKKQKLFGTSGIRGKIGEDISAELALNIGKSLATYLNGEGEVVIGYDTRTTNKMMESALIAGLIECECSVLRVGLVPTPITGFAAMIYNAAAGIMITASHNPSTDNGIKIWNTNGMAYTQSQEKEIEEIYFSKGFKPTEWNNIGKIYEIDSIKEEYINKLLSLVDIKPGLKVVVDSASGAGSELSPIIFRKAGCEVITLNSQIDGFFPGRQPEPNEANLQDLMKVVVATKSDIGIAHDGDADRMIAIDEKGRVSDFDKLLAIISKKSAEKFGGKIVTTVDAGLSIDKAVEDKGEVLRTKVGDVHVAEAMMEVNASFGGEPSGTWLHPEFCMCPDGILSGLKIAEIVSTNGPLSKLLDDIPLYPNARVKIPCSKEDKVNIMKEVESNIKQEFEDIESINSIDGVRLTFKDNSWVLIRPSGTENYIRITLEGTSQEKADEIKDISMKFINKYLNI